MLCFAMLCHLFLEPFLASERGFQMIQYTSNKAPFALALPSKPRQTFIGPSPGPAPGPSVYHT